MKDVGIEPSVIHFTTLIDGLSRAGNLEACKYSHEMVDVVCYTLMITGYVSFRHFVDRTLALQRGSSINKFSLTYQVTNNSDAVYMRRWIRNVVERCVLEVDLRVMPGRNWAWLDVDDVHGKCLLPCHLFRSKTLVKLSLGTNTNIGKLPLDGNDGDTCDVTIGLLQVKVLDVLGYKGTAKEFEHLKSFFLTGTECIPKVRVEFPENVVVNDAAIIQTRRDLYFTLVGVVSPD
ncbi:unnamed protein product, partial [Brassica rapa subsp. narinosa]